jgi:zinc transport system permease protein
MERFYELFSRWAEAGLVPAIFAHAFMVRGLFAALLVGPLFGGLGTLVVTKRLSFFVQAVANASLTGTAIGLLLGEPAGATWAGLYGFCLASALLVTYIRNRSRAPNDTVTGVFLAQSLGLGVIMVALVAKRFDIHRVEATLFGSLITLRDGDLVLLGITLLAALLLCRFLFNAFMLSSLNPALARARGLNPVLLDYVFVALATAAVVAGLKIVGALLILVMIVVPAAAARNVATNLRQFFWISLVLSTLSAVGGLLVSGWWPIPTGGAIAAVSGALFYLTLAARPFLGKRDAAHASA